MYRARGPRPALLAGLVVLGCFVAYGITRWTGFVGLGVVVIPLFLIWFENYNYDRGRLAERKMWERHYPEADAGEWDEEGAPR